MDVILVVGYNAWDVIFPLGDTPPPDGKTEVAPIVACGGGPGATAAVALARLGVDVRFVTVLSDDLPGRQQRCELEAAGVDLSLAVTSPGHATPRAVIRVDPRTGGRRIYWSRGNLPALDPGRMDPLWLEGVDLLYCDGHEAPAAAVLARAVRHSGMPIVLDAGSVRRGLDELVPLCTDVIGSEGFATAFTGIDGVLPALEDLRAKGPERVATTFGAAGVVALDAEGPRHVPAFDVPVVDTTGAGDVFHAGYARALVHGLPFGQCLRYGAAVAALKCRDYGGRAGLPDEAETQGLLSDGKARDERPAGWRGQSGPVGRG